MFSRFSTWLAIGVVIVSSISLAAIPVSQITGNTAGTASSGQQPHFANSTTLTLFTQTPNDFSLIRRALSSDPGISYGNYGYIITVTSPVSVISNVTDQLGQLSITYPDIYLVNSTATPFTPYNYYSAAQGNSQYYTPSNIYSAYSFGGANSRGLQGNGTNITIIDAYGDPFLGYDIVAFDNQTHLPPIKLTIRYLNNTPNPYNKSWAIETALDVEWAHAAAPGANIKLVITQNASSSLESGLSYVISRDRTNIISLSWGESERALSSSDIRSQDQLFKIAAEENITVLAASGDQGSGDGNSFPTVNYPASDPYVVGVGGTALSYSNGKYSESAWGGNSSGKTYGSGGGYSSIFSQPSWQTIGNKSTGMRGVPDVSADASTYTEVLLIADGTEYTVGGTSLSTPIWAGVTARIDQALGHPLSRLDPVLYQVYRSPYYSSALTTITTGSNGQFSAAPGWDPVTGLGTPKVTQLIDAVANLTDPYGAVVTENGSYGFSSASVSLNITGPIGQLTMNGTPYYYISYYHNATEYAKWGVTVNASEVTDLLSMRNGNNVSTTTTRIRASSSSMQFTLRLSYNGTALSYGLNGSLQNRNVMIPFAGEAKFGVGVEMLNPVGNITQIPYANFSGLKVFSGNGTLTNGSMWESHYSGAATGFSYSNISFNYTKTALEGYAGNPLKNGLIIGNSSSSTRIEYTTSYSNHVLVDFFLNTPQTGIAWYADGAAVSSSVVLSPGSHNITAANSSGNISSTRITVPVMEPTYLTVNNPVWYYTPLISYTLDGLISNDTNFGNFTVYTPFGANEVQFSIPGFRQASLNITAGIDGTVNLLPYDSNISIFVFQGGANVTVNGNPVSGSLGTYSLTIQPQEVKIAVSSPGFVKDNLSSFRAYPSKTYAFSIALSPANKSLYSLTGKIKDAIFGYYLSGAKVQLGSYAFGFTNSTGDYQLYAPGGVYNVTYSDEYYNTSTIAVNLTTNLSENISLFPQTLNLSNTFEAVVGFFLPIGYFSLYVSWSTKSSQGIASYLVEFSTSANMSGAREIPISSANQYAVIFPIGPAADYYVQIITRLVSGQDVPGQIQDLKGTALPNLLINAGIYIGIALYAFVAVRILRRAFLKRRRI